MEVGVRELKARLSSYLERAAQGEELVVTSHGRPVARLVALEARPRSDWLRLGAEEGWITPAPRGGTGADLLDTLARLGPKPKPQGGSVTDLLLAERDSHYADGDR